MKRSHFSGGSRMTEHNYILITNQAIRRDTSCVVVKHTMTTDTYRAKENQHPPLPHLHKMEFPDLQKRTQLFFRRKRSIEIPSG